MKRYFKMDFSSLSDADIEKCLYSLDKLSFCMPDSDVKDVWDVLYRLGVLLRGEKIDRKRASEERKKSTEKRRKRGEVGVVRKPVKKVLKARI